MVKFVSISPPRGYHFMKKNAISNGKRKKKNETTAI